MFDFSCGAAGLGSGLVTAAAWVTAIVQFLALAQELSQHTNTAKKKKKAMCQNLGKSVTFMQLKGMDLDASKGQF